MVQDTVSSNTSFFPPSGPLAEVLGAFYFLPS